MEPRIQYAQTSDGVSMEKLKVCQRCAVCDTRGDPFELFFCSDCQKTEGRVIERLLRERDEAVHDLLSRNLADELRDADDVDPEEASGLAAMQRGLRDPDRLRELLRECRGDPDEVQRRLLSGE